MKIVLDYILSFVLVFMALTVLSFLHNQAQQTWWTYADISNFYQAQEVHVANVCVGDTTQKVNSIRFVYGTDTGYPAVVVKELFLVDAGRSRVASEVSTPFIEVDEDGMVKRIQRLPDDLISGDYLWVLYLTINIHGIERDVPPIESNLFTVRKCDEQPTN